MRKFCERWLALLLPLFFLGASAELHDPIAILPGDYPDPSVIRVGSEYYAVATSGLWAPEFPLLKSPDLVHWQVAGAVFDQRPEWAYADFWAPEIFAYRGKYFVYYTARKRGASLCIGVATADEPQGPYADQGPVVCDELGSIDAAPTVDENGDLNLIWKVDGNSRGLPTPLVVQKLSADGTKLVGERFEILRNDQPWEANLVEAAYVKKRGDYFYLFYSGSSCCTITCDYALGVARSRTLRGPWEKYAQNPILAGNRDWKCPGHGTVVDDPDGGDYLFYHAFHAKDSVVVGRQPVIDPIDWSSPSGWPNINQGRGPMNAVGEALSDADREALLRYRDDFHAPKIQAGWHWPSANIPELTVNPGGYLELRAGRTPTDLNPTAAVVARSLQSADFVAETIVDAASLQAAPATYAGLATYGDSVRAVGVSVSATEIQLWRKGATTVIHATVATPVAQKIGLRVVSISGERFRFYYRADAGDWRPIGDEVNGRGEPWDLGLRIALVTSTGPEAAPIRFDHFQIEPFFPNL